MGWGTDAIEVQFDETAVSQILGKSLAVGKQDLNRSSRKSVANLGLNDSL